MFAHIYPWSIGTKIYISCELKPPLLIYTTGYFFCDTYCDSLLCYWNVIIFLICILINILDTLRLSTARHNTLSTTYRCEECNNEIVSVLMFCLLIPYWQKPNIYNVIYGRLLNTAIVIIIYKTFSCFGVFYCPPLQSTQRRNNLVSQLAINNS